MQNRLERGETKRETNEIVQAQSSKDLEWSASPRKHHLGKYQLFLNLSILSQSLNNEAGGISNSGEYILNCLWTCSRQSVLLVLS